MSRQLPHGIKFSCITRTMSMVSGTLFARTSLSTLLPDASKSLFYFPIMMMRRGGEGGTGGVCDVGDMAGLMSIAF
jgi:hypothetical protein